MCGSVESLSGKISSRGGSLKSQGLCFGRKSQFSSCVGSPWKVCVCGEIESLGEKSEVVVVESLGVCGSVKTLGQKAAGNPKCSHCQVRPAGHAAAADDDDNDDDDDDDDDVDDDDDDNDDYDNSDDGNDNDGGYKKIQEN